MAEQPSDPGLPHPDEVARVMADIAAKSRSLVEDFLQQQGAQNPEQTPVSSAIGSAFIELTTRMMRNPAQLMQAQFALWQDYMRLWQGTTQRLLGQESEPVIKPERADRRFKDKAWDDNVLFDFIKQSYLLSSRFVMEQVTAAGDEEGADVRTQRKVEFYTRQFVDAMAPTNFVMTNPEVLRLTVETKGENLLKGLRNMLEDLERGKGTLKVRMTDEESFEIGRNIATTPGSIVFQNDLLQLIQYKPTTATVHQRPLLIIPPWINKFYVLDLQAKNSFVRFCVEQGLTTFVISWVNPDEKLAHKSFEDYMTGGALAAVDAVLKATGQKDLMAIGYCLGGTLLATTLAYMAAKRDARIKAATFFASLVDFQEPGDLGVFIDEEQLKALEEQMQKRGFLEGSEMARTFNLLRANDLIWSFVVSNYLMGKDPFPFDLLYWNSDSTRLPAAMHSFYLRRCYHENKLVEAGGVTLGGVKIDLRRINLPAYWVSTREDHIAPWKSTYAATQLYKGEKRFVLAGSGHIAGVINPPTSEKYGYWTNEDLPADPQAWLEGATAHPGSWWPDWAGWAKARAGKQVPAREPGQGSLPAIEPAPGSFVKVRAA
ncbi:polyhydroxyalkanoate synthase [Arboricoccus pini]|uniref:Polyhydroxyalkanoate synthase n=1 Tax=Arboricoccus pini TaxID=1963835 RepID=A0A212QUP8_9PROT|nr:class I poly(R)-hydroxyalkanoic acid synthase [Arboricoccus pini]SNB63438.1 polyhydroxyalkanoate synthase [Arboricoccus pini]